MTDDYNCKCGNVIEHKKKIGKDFPQTKKCDKCGKRAKRNYKGISLVVPYEMKSTTV